jgi:hypothetical protein
VFYNSLQQLKYRYDKKKRKLSSTNFYLDIMDDDDDDFHELSLKKKLDDIFQGNSNSNDVMMKF